MIPEERDLFPLLRPEAAHREGMTEPSSSFSPRNSRPADFIGSTGPTYALVGVVLDRLNPVGTDPVHVQIARDTVRIQDPRFRPVYEFLQTPRSEREVREWLCGSGDEDDFLEALVETRSVIRIDTRSPQSATKSLKGLRLVPHCLPDAPSAAIPGRFDVKLDKESTWALSVGAALGEALFGEHEATDLPGVIKQVMREFGITREQAARQVLSSIPLLLQHDYARLEWVSPPR